MSPASADFQLSTLVEVGGVLCTGGVASLDIISQVLDNLLSSFGVNLAIKK